MYKVEILDATSPHTPQTTISASNSSSLKVLSGEIKRKLNAIDNFTFSVGPDSPAWDSVRPRKTLIGVTNTKTGEVEFQGRALYQTDSMTEDGAFAKTYECEGVLGYLNDSIQRHGEYHNMTPREYLGALISRHNSYMSGGSLDQLIDKYFELGTVSVANSTDDEYRCLGYGTTWNSIQSGLVNSLGGYISLKISDGTYYLNYTAASGSERTMSIALAKNLLSLERVQHPDELITRLVPLGCEIESTSNAITRLQVAGLLTDPDYWRANYRGVEWLGQLLINLGRMRYDLSGGRGINNVADALVVLQEARVVNSPDYWADHYGDLNNNVGTLLIKAANYITESATAYADASKPRLTLTSTGITYGSDYIDDTSAIALYGICEGTQIWDDVTDSSTLRAKGNEWLGNQQMPDSVALTALDLSLINERYEAFVLGDYYVANNPVLGVNQSYQLTAQSVNILEPQKSSLTFGPRYLTASQQYAAMRKK